MNRLISQHSTHRETCQQPPALGEATIDRSFDLTAVTEPFDSFWEGPDDVESGYGSFGQFYRANYMKHLPSEKDARILVVSCGPGYFVNVLNELGYTEVQGIDSDEEKIAQARKHGLNCRVDGAFPLLADAEETYDAIVCEQELNHLTKREIVLFLKLVWKSLRPGGKLICHGLNGANPIVGAETLAQNFDHFNTFTEYSLRQVLGHCRFRDVRVFPLHLYVFYTNPANYVAWGASAILSMFFRAMFILYGKQNRIFTKKIAAVAVK